MYRYLHSLQISMSAFSCILFLPVFLCSGSHYRNKNVFVKSSSFLLQRSFSFLFSFFKDIPQWHQLMKVVIYLKEIHVKLSSVDFMPFHVPTSLGFWRLSLNNN